LFLLGTGTLGVAAAAAPPAPAAATRIEVILTGPRARRHLVCGHRGDFRVREGNSLASFASADRAGLDLIEIDVETTADHIPVVVHDPWPRTQTYEALRRRRRAPLTLARALAWAEPIGRPLLVLDIKSPDLEPIVAVLREGRAAGRVVAFASDEPEYHRLRWLMPELDLMVRAHDEAGARAWAARKDPRIVMIHGDYEWLHGNVCRDLRALGLRTFANSWYLAWHDEELGARDSVGRLFRRGIDVAQTNHPPTAVAARDAANR
jgi:glycerophosphoryl diester phosphodiesterase